MGEKLLFMSVKKNNVINLSEATSTLALYQLSHSLNKAKEESRLICEMAVRSILKALNCKDNYTYGHSLRVAEYALILGHHLNLTKDELYELELSALFHDIGKIGIPDKILAKPERLDTEEFEIMKKHPEYSFEILKDFKNFEKIAINAKHHHERWDGRGYPDKLKREEIPLFSRFILIADTYDAITSSRVYRKGLSEAIAFQELLDFSEKQFDPYLVKEFIKAIKNYHQRRSSEKTMLTLIDIDKKAA